MNPTHVIPLDVNRLEDYFGNLKIGNFFARKWCGYLPKVPNGDRKKIQMGEIIYYSLKINGVPSFRINKKFQGFDVN